MGWYTIMLVGIAIPFFVVSAGKNDIIIIERGSWISLENLSIIIEESLKKSKCSNVYIFGDSVATETIFRDFVRIYRHDYIVKNRNNGYGCNGYFIISASASRIATVLETIPTNRPTEILIIIDDDVVESSMLFDVSMYQHADVNIATRNGLWMLSENYLETRDFNKISSPHEMMHKSGIVNLHGRELQASAVHRPPYCYLQTTVNRTVKGIKGRFYITNNQSELDGVEINIFMLIAERLNFTWIMRKPNDDYRYGRRNGTNWYGGIIGLIHRKEVDIVFGSIWMTLDHYEFTNFSHPWTEEFIHFLVPRPRIMRRSFWALTRPFSLKVWAAIFVIITVQSVYVYAKAWINPKIPKRFRNFFVTLTELMGQLVGVSISSRIQGLGLQLQLWHFIGILLVTAYSSNLAARLTNISYQKRIDSIEDFIRANLTWGTLLRAPLFSSYFDESDPYAKELPEHYKLEENENERHERILKGNYAILGFIISKVFFPEDKVRDEDYKGYRVMKQEAGTQFTTFAVQSWLLEPINEILLRLQETGMSQYHLYDVLHRRTGPKLRDVLNEYDINSRIPRVLKFTPLGVGFSMLIFGLAISSVVFYLELKYASGNKRSIRQVLRRIERNRDIWEANEIVRRKHKYPMLKRLKENKYGYARRTIHHNL